MENKNNNIFLGKIEKNGCYVNNGKYGYFLTCGKKKYKIPEYLLGDETVSFFLLRSWPGRHHCVRNHLKMKQETM